MQSPKTPERTHPTGAGTQAKLERWVLAASVGYSAALLFTLELLAGRLVLPVFGGAPSVWSTALCFYSGVLFLGYGYAHLSTTRLHTRTGGLLHICIALVAVAATLAAPSDVSTLSSPGLPVAINVLLALAIVSGPAAFLLSSTTPLLSTIFSRRHGDPWWLYAVSNTASLSGLLVYPFLIEPNLPLSLQRWLIAPLLALMAISLIYIVARANLARTSSHVVSIPAEAPASSRERPSGHRRVWWLLAAGIPAGLLSALNLYLTTDLQSGPLLWVGPFAIYLGSFVVAFSERGRRLLPLAEKAAPLAGILMLMPYVFRGVWPYRALTILLLACFAVIATAVHGRLASDRPDKLHLTQFYLVVSAGGFIATAFTALIAPAALNDLYEYPVLIISALMVLALSDRQKTQESAPVAKMSAKQVGWRVGPLVLVGLVFLRAVVPGGELDHVNGLVLLLAALAAAIPRLGWVRFIGAVVAIALLLGVSVPKDAVRTRSFFGVTEARTSKKGLARVEIHGTTVHGVQFFDDRRSEPTLYYAASGPLGATFKDLQERLPQGASIGAVGLGIGTLAAYTRSQDSLEFFEIDQAVVDLAVQDGGFSYIANSAAPPTITLGDGRLSLEAKPSDSFDLLVLDAFSSDEVPIHFLTVEAMRTYERVIRPNGIVALHLTNSYFNMVPAVAATARSTGFDARVRNHKPTSENATRIADTACTWLILGKPTDVARFDEQGWQQPGMGPILSDDFCSILPLLRAR